MRELRNCLEDVKDAKRPMERALQTRQSSHGSGITAQDRYYHFRNDTQIEQRIKLARNIDIKKQLVIQSNIHEMWQGTELSLCVHTSSALAHGGHTYIETIIVIAFRSFFELLQIRELRRVCDNYQDPIVLTHCNCSSIITVFNYLSEYLSSRNDREGNRRADCAPCSPY